MSQLQGKLVHTSASGEWGMFTPRETGKCCVYMTFITPREICLQRWKNGLRMFTCIVEAHLTVKGGACGACVLLGTYVLAVGVLDACQPRESLQISMLEFLDQFYKAVALSSALLCSVPWSVDRSVFLARLACQLIWKLRRPAWEPRSCAKNVSRHAQTPLAV